MESFNLVFENISTLLIALALVCIALTTFSYFKFEKTSFLRKLLSWTSRVLAIALISFTLTKPLIESKIPEGTLPVLLDISDSMDSGKAEELLKRASQLSDGRPLMIVPFAKKSLDSISAKSSYDFAQYQKLSDLPVRAATNLEQALSDFSSKPFSSVLLISDANETEGDARLSIPILQQTKIKVFPLANESGKTHDTIRISQFSAPIISPAQKTVDLRVALDNPSDSSHAASLMLSQDGKPIVKKELILNASSEQLEASESLPINEGLNELVAELKFKDADGHEKSISKSIFVTGEKKEKVLVLSGTADDDRFLSQLLKNETYQITNQVTAGSSATLPNLDSYSAVIVNNVPSSDLGERNMSTLKNYVQQGGGFIMVGGNKSFGLGGYISTPIEEILPVKLLPPQTVKKRLNIAVELVIDKSRSMETDNKIDYAKDAAMQVLNNLKDEDFFGVIGFDDAPFTALPMGQVANQRQIARERIGRIFATGRTNLFPAIDEARRALMRVNAGRKHMVILTDGKIPDAGPYYLELIRQIRVLGVTVSTILLGDEAEDTLLQQMANLGGGSYYQTADPRNLPKVFLSDVKVASGEQTLKEQEEFKVKAGPSPGISSKLSEFPSVKGYVQTAPKEHANLELVVAAAEKAEPLLASWSFGKGRAVAYTSDANGRWSASWINWPRFNQFWNDLLSYVRQKNGNERATIPKFDLHYSLDHGSLIIDLALFSEREPPAITGSITPPTGPKSSLTFQRIGKGRYQAKVENPSAGKYVADLRFGAKSAPPIAWNLSSELFGEQPNAPINMPLLNEIAQKTGGKVNPVPADLGKIKQERVERTPIDRYPLILALLLLLIEILFRELVPAHRKRFSTN